MTQAVTLIGLVGQAGAGKDTVAEHLVRMHGFRRYGFADPIKAALTAMLQPAGIDVQHWSQPFRKESALPGLGLSYRQLAQTLGTEWGRAQRADLWVQIAGMTLGLGSAQATPVHDRIVVSDVRFADEARWIERHGGVLIRTRRTLNADVRAHVSEVWARTADVWRVIDNDGSIEDLQAKVDDVIGRLLR